MPSSLPPYRSVFYEERLGWVESLNRTFLAWIAVLILSGLLFMFGAGLYLFVTR